MAADGEAKTAKLPGFAGDIPAATYDAGFAAAPIEGAHSRP